MYTSRHGLFSPAKLSMLLTLLGKPFWHLAMQKRTSGKKIGWASKLKVPFLAPIFSIAHIVKLQRLDRLKWRKISASLTYQLGFVPRSHKWHHKCLLLLRGTEATDYFSFFPSLSLSILLSLSPLLSFLVRCICTLNFISLPFLPLFSHFLPVALQWLKF